MTYFFETYGCQMNSAESAALRLVLAEKGWCEAPSGEAADLVLLNTCSVRATAEQRVMGRLGQYAALKKKRPFTLVVAGCMAQRLGASLKVKVPAVDYVMGTSSRSFFPLILDAAEQGALALPSDEQAAFSFSSSHLEDGRFRSFLPIMHGCDNYCSYCIVPYVRGREISRSPASVREELRLLSDRGVREVTLLGQNVNSYRWSDGSESMDFPALLELVAGETEGGPIRWVRFLSSHPKDLSSRAIEVMAAHPSFCRHIHLCVQHGSDPILAAMNRRYTVERYLELVDELRSAMPDISLSTDLLIGFPGETEKDFELTLTLMEKVRFQYSYMYHYNPREGTAAYALPGRVAEDVKRRRLAAVIALQRRQTVEIMRGRIGGRALVLIEDFSKKNADELVARTERDEMVVVSAPASWIGSFAEVTLAALRGTTFRAKEPILCP